MTQGSEREYTAAVRGRYLKGNRKEKGRILDEFTQVVGHHRKAAIRLLRRGDRPPSNRKEGQASQVWNRGSYGAQDSVGSR